MPQLVVSYALMIAATSLAGYGASCLTRLLSRRRGSGSQLAQP
jgi:hypothetical protein